MLKTLIRKYITNDDVPYSEHLKLKMELQYLQIKYDEIQKQLRFHKASHHDVPIAGFDELNDEPSSGKKRDAYVGDVVKFYNNILHRKIKVSIAEIRQLLSNIGRQEGTPLDMSRVEYDMFLRGMEAFAWKINDWAMVLDAERKQGLQDKENNDE
jgi:hypothetical protein